MKGFHARTADDVAQTGRQILSIFSILQSCFKKMRIVQAREFQTEPLPARGWS